ncbi:hypothetical protein CsSME_00045576 [Camellia sinensis var. sinensis]
MKHSCGSAAGVEEVSVDVVVEGVGGLGIRGGGTSSDGSFEVINSNNGDGGGVQVTCFTEVLEDVTLHFQIIRLHKQVRNHNFQSQPGIQNWNISMHGLVAILPDLDAYMPLHLPDLKEGIMRDKSTYIDGLPKLMAQWRRGKMGGRGQVFAANLEDEIEMSPSIERNIGYQNQRNEIEELSSQIATLDHQLDDFFGSPHRHRAYSHGLNSEWNGTVKDLEFPEFRGSYNPDVFEEWLKTIESHFQYYDVPEAKKVKLVSQSLKGRASNWWKQLQVGRQRNGQENIRE